MMWDNTKKVLIVMKHIILTILVGTSNLLLLSLLIILLMGIVLGPLFVAIETGVVWWILIYTPFVLWELYSYGDR